DPPRGLLSRQLGACGRGGRRATSTAAVRRFREATFWAVVLLGAAACKGKEAPAASERPRPVLAEVSPRAAPCSEQENTAPFNDYCEEEVWQLALRVDASNLGLRGWVMAGGAHVPVDARGAEAVATSVFRNAREPFSALRVSGP